MAIAGPYHAHQNDVAIDVRDLEGLLCVKQREVWGMIEPYWPKGDPILVRAEGQLAFVLPRPDDIARLPELDGLVDVLQCLVGPAKLGRPIRCYRYVRTRWREIDPRRQWSVTRKNARLAAAKRTLAKRSAS